MKVNCGCNCKNQSAGRCKEKDIIIDGNGVCRNFVQKKDYVRDDNVVVFDDAGIPSVMVRFDRPKDGSEDDVFTVNGVLYEELYISKYKNCVIGGKAYSLPMQKPATEMTMEEMENACFSKGSGWHMFTWAERSMIARICEKRGFFPHGNTECGKYHADHREKCVTYDNYRMLTGTGPDTWYSDGTVFGIDGLCGDIYERIRGLRIKNGVLQSVQNNDAAEFIDLSEDGDGWINVKVERKPVYVGGRNGVVVFSHQRVDDCGGCAWSEVKYEFGTEKIPEELKRLGLYPYEPECLMFADGTDGECLFCAGGGFNYGTFAGVAYSGGSNGSRTYTYVNIGFRSALFRNPVTLKSEPLSGD